MIRNMIIGALIAGAMIGTAHARTQISIVGSSTVLPFSSLVAEQYTRTMQKPSPIVESTGTGGGMKLFCKGIGPNIPDITNASRKIKDSEKEDCASNGVTPVEVMIGYDGIVVANHKSGPALSITREQLFMALAKKIYVDGKWVDNTYEKWSDIDASLPDMRIRVYGPPPTSGTRDAFIELVFHEVCKAWGLGKEAEKSKECNEVRIEGGYYIEAGENDNLLVQKLASDTESFAIFGFSFLDNNKDSVQGAIIDGGLPEFESISDGSYPISRSLYFYVKKEHVGNIPYLREFVEFFLSDNMIGQDGIATEKGLIPLSEVELEKMRVNVLEQLQ